MDGQQFEPEIIAFACHYCAYAAADLAGGLRLQYPASIKIIELPCSGKVDVIMALRAFEDGADGVMVAGWLEGDCHYRDGNINAKRRVERVQKLLETIGIEGERIRMFNLSSAMGPQFAQYAIEMTEQIRALGPSPLRKSSLEEMAEDLADEVRE